MFQIILHNNIVPSSILRDLTRNIYFDFIIFVVFYIYIYIEKFSKLDCRNPCFINTSSLL